MLELQNCALHATCFYPLLLCLLDKHLNPGLFHVYYCLSTVAFVGLGNFSNEATDKTTLFVKNGGLVLSRWDINRRIFGKEIGGLELNLMCLNWHYREICPGLAVGQI